MEFAQSRGVSHRQIVHERQVVIERVRAEYREMPGLCLSLAQGARLLGLDRPICTDVFRALVREGFLRETPRGSYVLAE
jgi:predicted RNA binding protein YcfA (HicA-like mRNA interferase family)